MLQSIRDHIQGWVAGIIIALLSVTFALWGIQNYLGSHSGKGAALVKLKDGKISVDEFNRYYRQLLSERPELASLTGAEKKLVQQQVLSQMIQKQALLDGLKDDGFSISAEQVRHVILFEPMFQENGQFSKKRFEQLLYANSINESQYIQRMQSKLMMAQLNLGLQQTAIVLPNEIEQGARLMNQSRDFGYFIIPAHLFDKQVKPTEKQIQQYYAAHRPQYQQAEQVAVNYLVLSPQKIADGISVSEEQIEQFYQANKAQYRTPRKWLVADITQESLMKAKHLASMMTTLADVDKALKAGKPFTAYRSQQHWIQSTDQEQATLVGALSKMKVGSVSGIIDDSGTGHIIKLIAVQDPETKPLSAVSAQVKKTLQLQQAQSQFSDQADQLSNLSYTSPNSLQPAAKALGLNVQSSGLYDRDSAKGLLAKPTVVAAAFNPTTITSGNNSNPINLQDGTMVVLRVAKHVGVHTKPLAAVKAQVRSALTQELAMKQAAKLAKTLKAKLVAGDKPSALASRYHIIWNQKSKVSHLDSTIPQAVMSAVFFMPYSAKDAASNLKVVAMKNNDTALIELMGVHVPKSSTLSAKQAKFLADSLRSFDGELDYNLFNQAAIGEAKVEIDQKLLATL